MQKLFNKVHGKHYFNKKFIFRRGASTFVLLDYSGKDFCQYLQSSISAGWRILQLRALTLHHPVQLDGDTGVLNMQSKRDQRPRLQTWSFEDFP